MGCCISDTKAGDDDDPVKKLGNIIGGDGSKVDIDMSTVPERRRSMTEVEVKSMKTTIYYQKKKTFEREESLDYNDSPSMQELRGFLDEPLGRFYLLVSFYSYLLFSFSYDLKQLQMKFYFFVRDDVTIQQQCCINHEEIRLHKYHYVPAN